MKFKGDIIITDPCYIIPEVEETIKCPHIFDYLSKELATKSPNDYSFEEREQVNNYHNIVKEYYIEVNKNDIWRNNSIDLDNGNGLEKYGFTNYLWGTTMYGDWSCTTFKLKEYAKNKKPSDITQKDITKPIGEFCADAGLVGVFLLKEVLNFNPTYDDHIKKPYTTTLIENFDGDVQYIIEDDSVYIKGIGNVNFITNQTGF
jgi:hypothetical protein